MSAPVPPAPRPAAGPARPGQERLRAWWTAAVAGLLVLLYLSVQLTYGAVHLPPPRFRPLAPGAVAHDSWADFRLVSLSRTDLWGDEAEGEDRQADPGATWVVAHLEVVPRRRQEFMLCTLLLVGTDGRSWEKALFTPSHEGESCVPDDTPDAAELGRTYPIVVGYQVPASEADHLAGVALDSYGWRSYPLLRPPA